MAKGRGRRGRRTKDMIKTARERIDHLFEQASSEALRGDMELANRYCSLAFTIAKRYNVRLSPGQKAMFCRKCGTFLLEAKTASTRIRSQRVITKCFSCGNIKRIALAERTKK